MLEDLETINDWLKEEYGISYTELCQEFNGAVELNIKYLNKIAQKDEEIERLNKREKELEENLLNMLNISIEDNNAIAETIEYIENEMPCLWEVADEWEDINGNYQHNYKEYDTQILLNKLKRSDKE